MSDEHVAEGGLLAALIICSLCAGGAIWGFIDTLAILGLGLSTLAAFSRRHSVLVLLGCHGRASSWIIRSGVLSIIAHSPTTESCSALGECNRRKHQARQ